ncbi:MAG: hypothetical protein PHC51_04590 [bacterium]|nr:hypothetical protein [bacterium]
MTSPRFEEFARNPSSFHKMEIEIEGRIERVFQDSLSHRFWRAFLRMLRRKFVGSDGRRYLEDHQRFLISSASLKKAEWLMVEHNASYGRLRLRRGIRIKARGEYIHRPSRRSSGRSRVLNTYGVLHFTHPPKGYLEIL